MTVWQKAGAKPYDYSVENTGYNFRTVKTYEPYVASTPTSCQMKRPSGPVDPAAANDRALGSSLRRALFSGSDFSFPAHGLLALDQLLINVLNGLSAGLLLFMLSSGLTLIFSMMGVLNFAHASFYMVGAYIAYSLTKIGGLLAGALHRADVW